VKLPIAEIAQVVSRANRGRPADERVLVAVDGVHGFGVEADPAVELGADIFFSGCHKWLFGPRGTGVVWAAPHAWERLSPTIPTFYGAAYGAWLEGRPPVDIPPGPLQTPGGFNCFEHKWALSTAFAFHDGIGREEVTRRTHALAGRLKDGLAGIGGVRVVTPRDEALSAGLVCVDVPGRDPGEVAERLQAEHAVIASVTPYAERFLRFGPSIANSEEDVDRAVEAMAAIIRS
jgi:selenocysteine lyase/cysteine desulfurase